MSHSEKCKYNDTDKMQYACMEIMEEKRILIAAEELALFDKYLDYAKKNDEGMMIDLEQPDREPLRIVDGGMFLSPNTLFENYLPVGKA